jgi:hypothetical protein
MLQLIKTTNNQPTNELHEQPTSGFLQQTGKGCDSDDPKCTCTYVIPSGRKQTNMIFGFRKWDVEGVEMYNYVPGYCCPES